MYDRMEKANETGETNKMGSHVVFVGSGWTGGWVFDADEQTYLGFGSLSAVYRAHFMLVGS